MKRPLHSRYPTFSTLTRHIESLIVSSHGRANSEVHPSTYHSFSECQSSPILGAVKSSNLHTYAGSKPDSYKTSVLPYRGHFAFQHLSLRSAASMIFEKSCTSKRPATSAEAAGLLPTITPPSNYYSNALSNTLNYLLNNCKPTYPQVL